MIKKMRCRLNVANRLVKEATMLAHLSRMHEALDDVRWKQTGEDIDLAAGCFSFLPCIVSISVSLSHRLPCELFGRTCWLRGDPVSEPACDDDDGDGKKIGQYTRIPWFAACVCECARVDGRDGSFNRREIIMRVGQVNHLIIVLSVADDVKLMFSSGGRYSTVLLANTNLWLILCMNHYENDQQIYLHLQAKLAVRAHFIE